MENSLPVWLSGDFHSLVEVAKGDRLPHGLLLVGRQGDGASIFTQAFADFLLCQNPSDQACGICKSCKLNQSGTHPDFLKIEPDGKSMTIKVDAVRRIAEKVSETAQQGGNKVIYLQAAETMNVNAANALLKVLEEPTANTFILLEAADLSSTLPTIRSRCRIVQLSSPGIDQAQQYLSDTGYTANGGIALGMTANAPIDAAKVTVEQIDNWLAIEENFFENQSFIQLSQFVTKQDLTDLFEQILLWIDCSLKLQNGQNVLAPVSDRLLNSLGAIPSITLFQFRDYIVGILGAFHRHANLNSQLMAEELAAKWIQLRGFK